MARDLLKGGGEGRFYSGNLHCHSNASDGLVGPEEEHGWRVVDTRFFRDETFTTILGAEISFAPWDEPSRPPTTPRRSDAPRSSGRSW